MKYHGFIVKWETWAEMPNGSRKTTRGAFAMGNTNPGIMVDFESLKKEVKKIEKFKLLQEENNLFISGVDYLGKHP